MNNLKNQDIVYLHGIQCPCTIGVNEWEKHTKQTLVLDIDLATNAQRAATKDDLNDALDYQVVTRRVQEFAAAHTLKLIETLAERIAELILNEFDTAWVRIKLDKGQAVKGVNNVGIMIERERK